MEETSGSPIHRVWRILDQNYMKPMFGGRLDRGVRSALRRTTTMAMTGTSASDGSHMRTLTPTQMQTSVESDTEQSD